MKPTALRMVTTLWRFGCSECNRVKGIILKDPRDRLLSTTLNRYSTAKCTHMIIITLFMLIFLHVENHSRPDKKHALLVVWQKLMRFCIQKKNCAN